MNQTFTSPYPTLTTVVSWFSLVFNSYSIPLPPAERAIDFPKCGRCFAGLVCEYTFARVAIRSMGGVFANQPLAIYHGAVLPGLAGEAPFGTYVKANDAVFLLKKWRPAGRAYLVQMDLVSDNGSSFV